MPERIGRLGFRTVLALLWAAAGYYFLFGGEYSASDLAELRQERRGLQAELDSLEQVTDSLTMWADSLVDDRDAIERVARERYGFIRDGERLYRFVKVEAPPSGEGGDRPVEQE